MTDRPRYAPFPFAESVIVDSLKADVDKLTTQRDDARTCCSVAEARVAQLEAELALTAAAHQVAQRNLAQLERGVLAAYRASKKLTGHKPRSRP